MPALPSLAAALAAGDLLAAVEHLQSAGALTASLTTPAAAARLAEAEREHDAALSALLSATLPLLALPAAATQHGDPEHAPAVRAAVAALVARRHVLPPPHGPPPRLPADAAESASAALAVAAGNAVDEAADAWARAAPDFAVDEPAALPAAVRAARDDAARLRAQAAARRAQAAAAAAVTRRLAEMGARAAVEAAEEDVAERAADDAAHRVAASLLCARGEATAAKLRLQEAELRAEMYGEADVKALEKIMAEIERREAVVEEQLREAEGRLAEYRALGPEFEDVVRTFVEKRAVLEEKVWSRDELVGRR